MASEQQAASEVRRIAVIVVAGVGEQSASATLLHGNLIESVDSYVPGDTSSGSVPFAVAPIAAGEWGTEERTLEDVPTAALRRAGPGNDPDKVDIFEMPWSDLSRFPTGLPGFIATMFGLAVQFGTIGLEAIAGVTRGSSTPTRDVTRRTMSFASWVAAALVIPVTAAMVVAAVNLWLVLDAPGGVPELLMPLAVGVAGAVGVWFVAKAIADGGWAYGGGRLRNPVLWAFAIYAGTCTGWVLSYLDERSVRIASAETLLYGAGYALRAVWLGALAALAGAVLALLGWPVGRRVKAWRSGRDALHGEGFVGRWVSGVLTTIASPLAVASVGTLLFAGIASVAFKSAGDARWGTEADKIRCFSDPSSWQASTGCGSKRDEWPQTAATIKRLHAEAKRLTEQAAQESDREQAVALRNQAADKTNAANAIEADAKATPVDWARALFVIITIPLFNAMVALVVLVALGLLLFVLVARTYRKKPGTALAKTLRGVWHPVMGSALASFVLGGVVATWCIWLGSLGPLSFLSGDPWESDRAWWLSVAGLATVGLLLISRFFPIDLRVFGGDVGKLKFGGSELGGNLEALRKRLDPAYDIASYLRIYRSKTGTRPTIIARYRALLREIARREYDGLVIVAHSQGAVLSTATLFGDRYRRDPEAGNENSYGIRGWVELKDPPDLPKNVVLITCGCPLRQGYDARMPGDYSWLWGAADLRPLSLAWINAYWPRDYVGQAMFRSPLTAESREQGRVFKAASAGLVDRLDVCLNGKGGHVGYFTDAEFAKWVDYAVTLCMGEQSPPYPSGYAR